MGREDASATEAQQDPDQGGEEDGDRTEVGGPGMRQRPIEEFLPPPRAIAELAFQNRLAAIDQVVADMATALWLTLLDGLASQGHRAAGDFELVGLRASGDLFHGTAIAVTGAEVLEGVHSRRVGSEDGL